MTKIENMIDLRSFCLEQAIKIKCEYEKAGGVVSETPIYLAREYEKYILGDSKLPKSPISLNDIINNYALKMVNDSEKQKEEFDKLLETLANSKQE